MRLFIPNLGFTLIGLWMNIIFNSYVQISGLKINWILIFLLIQTFRHSNLKITSLGIPIGLIIDALSHGIMGLYGASFFFTLLVTGQVKKFFFANTYTAVSLAVFGMSIFEGWISISILNLFEPNVEIFNYIMTSTFPLSILQGLITPIILQFIIWGENIFIKDLP